MFQVFSVAISNTSIECFLKLEMKLLDRCMLCFPNENDIAKKCIHVVCITILHSKYLGVSDWGSVVSDQTFTLINNARLHLHNAKG